MHLQPVVWAIWTDSDEMLSICLVQSIFHLLLNTFHNHDRWMFVNMCQRQKSCTQCFQTFVSVHYKEGKRSHSWWLRRHCLFCRANPGNREPKKCANIHPFEIDSKDILSCKSSHSQTGFLIWNKFSRNLIIQQNFQWQELIGKKLFWNSGFSF